MASESEVLEILGAIGAQLQMEIADSTESMWFQMFQEVDGEKLKGAVIAYLARATHRRLPMPGEIFELIAKRTKARHHGDLADVNCDKCGQLGLVRIRKPHPRNEEIKIDVMVPCHCVLGEAKVAYLERERRRG